MGAFFIKELEITANKIFNYKRLQNSSINDRARISLNALTFIIVSLFQNIKPENFSVDVNKALEEWIDSLEYDIKMFNHDIKYRYPNHKILKSLRGFNRTLTIDLKKIINKNHDGFTNYKDFIKTPLPYENDKRYRIQFDRDLALDDKKKIGKKLIYLRSPIPLIKLLKEQNKMKIENVENFVYSAFEFRSNYNIPPHSTDFFIDLSKIKHTFTAFIEDIWRDNLLDPNISKDKIILFIKEVMPNSSMSSIRRYCSPSKNINKINRIDIQSLKY